MMATGQPPALGRTRCLNHGQREAAGRCTGCGRLFCRECLTEEQAGLRCSSCLVKIDKPPEHRVISQIIPAVGLIFMVASGFILLFLGSYHLGRLAWDNAAEARASLSRVKGGE